MSARFYIKKKGRQRRLAKGAGTFIAYKTVDVAKQCISIRSIHSYIHVKTSAVCTLIFTLQKSEMGLSFGSAFHMAARSLTPRSQMPLRDSQLCDPQMQLRDP